VSVVPVAAEPRLPFAKTVICEEAQAAAAEVLASGWVTSGPEVVAFEREFADWVGARHAVAVASCTAAIEIALRALRLPPRAKVLTPTINFCGAVHAIVHAGLEPVLVDVDEDNLMPTPATVASAVRRSGRVDAMVVVHYAGNPAAVRQLAEAAGLPLSRVVEDAAHALGTWAGSEQVGSISGATCFSFYATKNLPIGEGGMITTADADLADYYRQARLHGMSSDAWKRYLPGGSWRYSVEVPGLKANLTDLQAAIGRAQLRRLGQWQSRRAELAALYDAGLASVSGLSLPARPRVGTHAWHLYVVQVEEGFGTDRDTLFAQLSMRGIDCSVHFIPVHHFPHFQRLLSVEPRQFRGAEAAFPRLLSLPFHLGLSEADVERVCVEIASIGAEARR